MFGVPKNFTTYIYLVTSLTLTGCYKSSSFKPIYIQNHNLSLAKCQGNDWLLRDSQRDIDKHLCTKSSSTIPFLEISGFIPSLIFLRKVWFMVKAFVFEVDRQP